MKKKPARKAKSVPEYDPQRQQNVLLEKIYTEVKTIGEGHSGLDRRMGRMEDRFDGVDQRLDSIDTKLIQVDNRLTEHDKRFDRIEMVVTENRDNIKVLKTGQEELKTDVGRIEHKLDTSIANHEQRIQKLETV